MSGGSGAGLNLWLQPTPTGLRQASKPAAGGVSLAGSARLSAIKRLQHLVQRVQVYGPDLDVGSLVAVSAWEFFLPGARLLLMLSPQPYRGFSGEGSVLPALTQASGEDAGTVSALLAWEAAIDPAALVKETGFSAERVHRALQYLSTSGHVGFDLHEQSHFHRQLPLVDARLDKNYPRLVAARALVEAGAVTTDNAFLKVASGDHFHWVGFTHGSPRCTCEFWAKYAGSRGPCKHVLAAQLFLETRA